MEEKRYKKMVEITQETQKYILEFLSTNKNMSQDCKESFMFLYKRRLTKKVWLRPFVVASVYEYFSGKSYVNILPAVAAAEVFNISTYQSNIVFDDKINDNHTSSINQVISSYISFNIAVQMLTSIENIDDKKAGMYSDIK